jgi:flagellar hook-associated protein FlgK
MSSVGTFGTFTAAQLGIYASQKGLSVTGNNIANINTAGYTRQVLQQVSLKTGGADRYANKYDVHVGQGVLCTGVSQIRDPYLDIRFRSESSKVGYADAVLGTYNDLASILDEVADGKDGYGILSSAFDSFIKALGGLNVEAGQKVNDTLVQEAAKEITNYFHKYANELQELKNNKEEHLRQNVEDINKLLTGIRDLNAAIRKSEIHGDNALEMRDDRNLMIDELSKYLKIDVVYSMEDIGAGLEVEKLTIKLGDANPEDIVKSDEITLVDGIYAAQLTTPKKNPAYKENFDAAKDEPIAQFKYLDPNGDGTNDPLKAKQEFDENYNIGLSKLLDSKGREWKETKIQKQTLLAGLTNPPLTEADLKKANENPILIKNEDGTSVWVVGVKGTITQGTDKNGNPTFSGEFITTTYSEEVEKFDDNDFYGELQANREMLTEEGEFATGSTIQNIDESAAIKRGIPYYQKSLDLLAKKFAETYNKANQGYLVDQNGNYVKKKQELDAAGNPVMDADGNPVYVLDEKGEPVYEQLEEITYYKKTDAATGEVTITTQKPADMTGYEELSFIPNKNMNVDETKAMRDLLKLQPEDDLETKMKDYLDDNGGVFVGGNLFSIRNDKDTDEGITASNIDIAYGWSSGKTHIVTSFIKPCGDVEVSTEGSNVIHMIALLGQAQVYNPQDWYPADKMIPDPNDTNVPPQMIPNPDIAQNEYLFKGSFTEFINNMSSVLGSDQSKMGSQLDTSYNAAVELDSSRMGTSSVDLNDEAMNLMQYSKSLNAAYRLMTTIDEALDRLINNTGVVGR